MQEASSKTEIYRDIAIGAATLIALYVVRLDSYLLFHSLAELFSIAVVGGLFAVTWASRYVLKNNYLLLLGVSYIGLLTSEEEGINLLICISTSP